MKQLIYLTGNIFYIVIKHHKIIWRENVKFLTIENYSGFFKFPSCLLILFLKVRVVCLLRWFILSTNHKNNECLAVLFVRIQMQSTQKTNTQTYTHTYTHMYAHILLINVQILVKDWLINWFQMHIVQVYIIGWIIGMVRFITFFQWFFLGGVVSGSSVKERNSLQYVMIE